MFTQSADQLTTTTGTLALFDTTKEQRKFFAEDVVNRIENGEADPIKVHLYAKSMEQILKSIFEHRKYKAMLLEAVEKYGKGGVETHNGVLKTKEAGVSYDYSVCNDPEYNRLETQLEEIKEQIKQRQNFLKTINPKGVEVLFDDEVLTVYPPAKSSTTTVETTLN